MYNNANEIKHTRNKMVCTSFDRLTSQQHSRYTFGFEFSIEPIEPHLVKRTFYVKGLSRVAFQFCERMVRRSPVLWPGLIPNCLLDIRLFWSRWFCNCLSTTDSKTLLTMQSNEIGRYLDGSAVDSLLWIGMTVAVFHCPGNTPCEKQRWKRWHRGLASSALHSLRTLAGMWSELVALSGTSCFNNCLIILGLKMMSIDGIIVGESTRCGEGASACIRKIALLCERPPKYIGLFLVCSMGNIIMNNNWDIRVSSFSSKRINNSLPLLCAEIAVRKVLFELGVILPFCFFLGLV